MKIVLGMSGGVDSAAAAYVLQQAGHTVAGVTLVMYPEVQPDIAGAEETAKRLGILHTVVDCSAAFRTKVLDYFAAAYRDGDTPNPCVVCNPTVKFAALLSHMEKIGYDAVATGHYARLAKNAQTGKTELLRGLDAAKDQSYMLCRLTQEQLSHAVFPLAEFEKPAIQELAAKQGLLPQIPKDSMDICFLPNGDYASYLEEHFGFQPQTGDFQLADGTIVGRHQGQWRYTVGQRKGLGIACGYPVYVTGKNPVNNLVTVGKEEELFSSACKLRDCNWLSSPQDASALTVKVRYSRRETGVELTANADGTAELRFSEPQRAVTCGQSAVIYEGDRVIGGGFISQVMQ